MAIDGVNRFFCAFLDGVPGAPYKPFRGHLAFLDLFGNRNQNLRFI